MEEDTRDDDGKKADIKRDDKGNKSFYIEGSRVELVENEKGERKFVSDENLKKWAGELNYIYNYGEQKGGGREGGERKEEKEKQQYRADLGKAANPPSLTFKKLSKITVTKGLKGGSVKKICLVNIDDQDFILKGGARVIYEGKHLPDVSAANVAASEFIQKLGLKGVVAPVTRLMDDEECDILINALRKLGTTDAEQLAESIESGGAQISEKLPGMPFEEIFLAKSKNKEIEFAIKTRKGLPKDKNAAQQKVLENLAKQLIGKPQIVVGKFKIDGNGDSKQLLRFLNELNFSSFFIRESIKILEEINEGEDAVNQSLIEAKNKQVDLTKKKNHLADWAKSEDGVEAFAGVAVIDLVAGMFDRILGAWNGGNFLFDSQGEGQLCCIDNAKMREGNASLTADNSTDWLNEIGKYYLDSPLPLEDLLFAKIYRKDSDSAPGNYVNFNDPKEIEKVKRTIRLVLNKVIDSQLISNTRAQERVLLLKKKIEDDSVWRNVFKIHPEQSQPPPYPADPRKADKVKRAIKARFTSNKKDKKDETDDLKKKLRNDTIAASEARAEFKELSKNAPEVSNDLHLSNKMLFLISVKGFCETLSNKAKGLNGFLEDQRVDPQTLRNAAAPLRAVYDLWHEVLFQAKETELLRLLEAAWDLFPDEVKTP